MPNPSELYRVMMDAGEEADRQIAAIKDRHEHEAAPLQYETVHRRPMTGYENFTDDSLLEMMFSTGHPVVANHQLRRELRYRLIERGNQVTVRGEPRNISELTGGIL